MRLDNPTPLAAIAFRQFDAGGGLDGVVAVKAIFDHCQNSALKLHGEQEPLQWEDAYDGDPHATPLVRQTDLTPGKAGTDVTFLGKAFAPGGTPSPAWTARLAVGPIDKSLRIFGRRQWHPVTKERWAGIRAREPRRQLVDWTLSETEPVSEVPLDWRKALGGLLPTQAPTEPPAVDRHNPLGCGLVSLESELAPRPAHQVAPYDEAEPDWRDPNPPAGFGPIPPWWRDRQRHAGTYDDAWLETRHPLLPEDFDIRFWQSAPPDQVAVPFLKGDENYRLENLSPEFPVAAGRLPDIVLAVRLDGTDADGWRPLVLDGVHVDWRSDHRVCLTWRTRFPLPKADGVTLTLGRVVEDRPRTREAATRTETADVGA